MKTQRSLPFALLILLTGLLITFCGSPEESIPGTWITESVEASIDSANASAATLASVEKAIAMAKTTTFTLNEDHSMVLTIEGYQSDAFWSYDEQDGVITFLFEEGEVSDPIELGKFKGDKIVYTSSVKNGNITAVYIKK